MVAQFRLAKARSKVFRMNLALSGKNRYVHGARGLFAFSVFVFHICNSGLPPRFMSQGMPVLLGHSLQYGVELFFGISGFVILGACRRAQSTSLFLVERCTRIYPVLWATICTILVGAVFMHQHTGVTPSLDGMALLAANLLAMPNVVPLMPINPAAWTLSFEFSFYILIALYMARWQAHSRLRKIGVVVIGVWLLTRQFRAVFFLSGLLISLGLFEQGVLRRLIRWPLVWLGLFLLCWTAAIEALGMPTGIAHLLDAGLNTPWIPACVLLGWVSGTLALAGIAYGEGMLGWLTLTRPVQWLGTISYSLYLWQAPIIGGFHHFLINSGLAARAGNFAQPLLFIVALPPVLLVAALSQHFLEMRATNWLRRTLEGQRANLKLPA
jgi:peptidoglycan/LPS O-acetylase OafA/YrhL